MNYYVLAIIVFVIDIILYSLLPVYNNANEVLGMTMFYAYQIIMLVVSSALFLVAVLLGDRKKSR